MAKRSSYVMKLRKTILRYIGLDMKVSAKSVWYEYKAIGGKLSFERFLQIADNRNWY